MKFLAAALFLMATTSIASADIPPPNSSQCGNKKNGDACELDGGGEGHCVETTCSRARPDGNSTYPCTLCEPGAPEQKEAPAPAAATPKKSNCAGAGAESLLALGGAIALIARRR